MAPARASEAVDRPGSVAPGAPDGAMPAGPLAGLLDAIIDAAPACVEQRMLLQAVDWRCIPRARVAALLSRFRSQGVAVPAWLARGLLLAGHLVPAGLDAPLSPELRMLGRLNAAAGTPAERPRLAVVRQTAAASEALDADVATAIVRRLAELGLREAAAEYALLCWERAPRALTAAAPEFAAYRGELPLARLRVAGFSTTLMLAQDLIPAFASVGWRAEVAEASFGEGLAELLRPAKGADALILLMDAESFAPRDWRRPAEESLALVRERSDVLAAALASFCRHAECPLLINTIPSAPAPAVGMLDRQHAGGLRRAVDLVNARIVECADRSGQILLIDGDTALASIAAMEHSDPKLWFYGRLAYSAKATRALAKAFAQAWMLLKHGPAKVLALDLDNTLWGGVYGDDGLDGLACGEDFPGNAFSAFQRECLRLKSQGMLLAAVSKNDPDAITVFARHPGMVLAADDFTATAIDWQPKPDNVRKLARDLALGLESFVFLDDSRHEREAMRRMCPAVAVPEMPDDPAMRPLWLRRLVATWPVRLTAEDERRPAMYAAERAARELRQGATSFEAYLAGLEQRLTVERVRFETVARVAQMHQRTNQFNLTSARLGDADIRAMIEAGPGALALLGRVVDKFGDHGIVVAATVQIEEAAAVIRSLVMSCRVIGRQVEHSFLGELLAELDRCGVREVTGIHVPTAKNGMVRDFYPSVGFRHLRTEPHRTLWSWTLGDGEPPRSAYVRVE